jgi:uncharacterized Tic20 family protein
MADDARYCGSCGIESAVEPESQGLRAERFVYRPPGEVIQEPGSAGAASSEPERHERNMAMLVHASIFSGFVIPFGNVVGPLVVWLLKREESSFVDRHGKAALNFQISLMIYMLISAILVLVLIGIIMLIGLFIFDLVYTIIAMIRASDGKEMKYPPAIPFFK